MALALAGLVLILIFQLLFIVRRCKPRGHVWANVDTVGVKPGRGILSWALAIVKSTTSMQGTMRTGYYKYSKFNKPFALPTMWTGGALLVLPSSMLNLLNKPRNELSGFEALLENAQFQYLMTDKDVWGNTIHFDIVNKNLASKHMGALGGIMAEEWDGAFGKCWSKSKEWSTVNAWDSMVEIIGRVSLRIMVGNPSCRNEEYLRQSKQYANAVLVDACFINCLPPIVRPVAGRLLAIRARYHQRRLLKILVPMVEERLRKSETDEALEEEYPVSFVILLVVPQSASIPSTNQKLY